jgi:hypothetical protein
MEDPGSRRSGAAHPWATVLAGIGSGWSAVPRRLVRPLFWAAASLASWSACGGESTGPAGGREERVTVGASRDNTIYEENSGLSNGAGEHLFAGTNNFGDPRRALIHFDLSSVGVPTTATVDSVHLTLRMSRTQSAARAVSLRRVTASWGEGSSISSGEEGMGAAAQRDDATWSHRFFGGEPWGTPGGAFSAATSGTVQVDGIGSYTWRSTPAMVADVQAWVPEAAQNHGWVLIGDESAARTSKRFDSRSNSVQAGRPSLTVFYRVP